MKYPDASKICDPLYQNKAGSMSTLKLSQNITIEYQIGDQWFIITVTFGCLDGLLVIFAVWFAWYYKKSKEEHLEFRKRREKWLQYDTVYKARGMPSNDKGSSPQLKENEEETGSPKEGDELMLKTPSEIEREQAAAVSVPEEFKYQMSMSTNKDDFRNQFQPSLPMYDAQIKTKG